MNLKESFRYQNFLDFMMRDACSSISRLDHCILTRKLHKKQAANPEDEDMNEVVEVDPFVENDIVIAFMDWLIDQKLQLGIAIGEAKASIPIDIDAEIGANKFRQKMSQSIGYMLSKKPRKRQEIGTGYKFNVEGNQTMYNYTIDVEEEEMFDRVADKKHARELLFAADNVSADIDAALVNTEVKYEPVFDVNETFDDVIERFAEEYKAGHNMI